MVFHHLRKFSGHRLCCRSDITYLVFHVILQDHVIKGLCKFMEGNSSMYIPTLPSLVVTSIVVLGIK